MPASAPTVSVVVPTYNGARFLEATLRSLRRQTHPALEIVVVDDGSTDGTEAIARDSPDADLVVRQERMGVAVARNRGMARASGRWVGFVDQDDLWHHDRIARLLAYAGDSGATAVASREHPFALESDRTALARIGDGRESWPRTWIADGAEDELARAPLAPSDEAVEHITVTRLRQGAATITTTVLYDRELAQAAGGLAPSGRALDDHILNLNVARIAGPIPRLPAEDVFYRVHPASTTTVSPMVGPFLSAMAAVRLGGMFPDTVEMGSNIEHLLFGMAEAPIDVTDKLALLLLTAPRGSRLRWGRRWLRRALSRRLRAGRP